jgi:hypothetical protein
MKQINSGWARVGKIVRETGLGRKTVRMLARDGRVRTVRLGPGPASVWYLRDDVFAVLGWTPGDNTKPAPTEPQ